MESGLNKLSESSGQLLKANTELTKGSKTINEGAAKLEEGITTFNKEGIQKICNYINSNVKDVTIRIEELTELSKQYNNFTMLEDGSDGEVKFIMIVDAIKKSDEQENSKQDAIIEDKNKKN